MSDTATDHLERPGPGLGTVQRRRRLRFTLAGASLLLALPFVHSIGPGEGPLHEGLEVLGMGLIAAAILGRSWCALYIGGRKSHEVVATGPYSISRNPLYFFSLIAVFGIGLQTGSIVMGLLAFGLGLAIFYPVILSEEKALARLFGAEYQAYLKRVPRFGPDFALWRDMESIVVHPRRLRRTFLEALPFLLAIPICEAIEKLQDAGHLVPFIHIP